MYKSKIKLLWYKPGDIINQEDEQYCADWIKKNFVEEVGNVSSKPKVNLDLNGDGKVDKKDASIAGKVLGSIRKSKRGKK
jgi:hypothetical protein